MTAHSRPVDKKPAAKKRKPKRLNGNAPGPKPSRTAINPAQPWPFPPGGRKS